MNLWKIACWTLALYLCVLLLGSLTVYAGETEDNVFMLEEVTVTAEKREQNVQKTALAVTAITGNEVAGKLFTTIEESLRNVPSVEFGGQVSGGYLFIRGIGANTNDPAVNLNVDGVYQQQTMMATQAIYDVDRIEVLRGPQGTLYGRNATGGSVNIITSQPTDEFEGSGSIQFGNYNELRSEGMINVPASEKLSFRGAFASEYHDGFLDNGNADADTRAGRFKAKYQANEDLTVIATFEAWREGGSPNQPAIAPIQEDDPWVTRVDRGLIENRVDTYSLSVNWDLGWGILDFIPSYSDAYHMENMGPPMARAEDQEQITSELRLSSSAESNIQWVGGLYWLQQESYNVDVENILDQYDLYELPMGSTGGDYSEQLSLWAKSYAVFGQTTVSLTKTFRLTGGLRYTKDEKIQDYHIINDETGYDSGKLEFKEDYDAATFKAGVEYDVAENSMLYASVANGYKAGGLVFGSPSYPFDPEKLMSYSVGSKNRFFESRLQVNAEAYYYDYEDYQIRYARLDPLDGSFEMRTDNASGATIYGMEIESSLLITPKDTLDVSMAYMNTEFGEFEYYDQSSNLVVMTGGNLPNSPEWSGTIGYEHTWDIQATEGRLSFQINSHISKGYYNTFETSMLGAWQPSYHKSNAYLVYSPQSYKWSVRFYCKNLEDEPVSIFAADAEEGGRVMLQDPRTYGITFSSRF